MKRVTICLLCRGKKLLIGIKKRGPGVGKRNMPGGHIEELEDAKSSAKREILEESGIEVKEGELKQVAVVGFYFDGKYVFESCVFLVKDFVGEAKDTDEMEDFNLYPFDNINDLPFDEMWVADRLWIPLILRDGKEIYAVVNFNADGTKVENFSYKEVKFD